MLGWSSHCCQTFRMFLSKFSGSQQQRSTVASATLQYNQLVYAPAAKALRFLDVVREPGRTRLGVGVFGSETCVAQPWPSGNERLACGQAGWHAAAASRAWRSAAEAVCQPSVHLTAPVPAPAVQCYAELEITRGVVCCSSGTLSSTPCLQSIGKQELSKGGADRQSNLAISAFQANTSVKKHNNKLKRLPSPAALQLGGQAAVQAATVARIILQ